MNKHKCYDEDTLIDAKILKQSCKLSVIIRKTKIGYYPDLNIDVNNYCYNIKMDETITK